MFRWELSDINKKLQYHFQLKWRSSCSNFYISIMLIEMHLVYMTFRELVTGFHYTDSSDSVVIIVLALYPDSPGFDSKYRHCS
jgi:hypothetical protein